MHGRGVSFGTAVWVDALNGRKLTMVEWLESRRRVSFEDILDSSDLDM